MKKFRLYSSHYIFVTLTLVSIIFSSCCVSNSNNSSSTTTYQTYNDAEQNFYTSENSKIGEDLEKKYPNEDFIIDTEFSLTTFEQGDVSTIKKKEIYKDKINAISLIKSTSGDYKCDLYLTEKEEKSIIKYLDRYRENISQERKDLIFENLIAMYNYDESSIKNKKEYDKRLAIENKIKMPNPAKSSTYNHKLILSTKDFTPTYVDQIQESEFIKHKNYKASFGNGSFIPSWSKIINPEDGNFNNGNTYFKYKNDFPIRGTNLEISHDLDYENAIYNCVNYIPNDLKCKKKIITFKVPNWLEIEIVEKNFNGLKFKKTNTKPKEIPVIDTVVITNLKSSNSTSIQKTVKKKKKNSADIEKKETYNYITYEFENVGSYEDYGKTESTNGPSYYLPQLVILYKKAEIENKTYPLTGTVSGLCKWYKLLISNLKNDTAAAGKKAFELTKNLKTDEEKIKTVYYWIQDNIRYVAKEDGLAGFIPENCNSVFSDKFGDCKGMANLMYVMLKSLKLDARRVWIGTNHLNYTYDSTPGLMTDNHMICAVKLNNKFLFLDGTEKYVPYNEVAYRIQDRECILEDGDSFLLVKIPSNSYTQNKETTKGNFNLINNNLEGKIELSFDGESRLNIIRSASYSSKNSIDNNVYDFLSGTNNIIPSNIMHTDFENREGLFELKYDVVIKNHIINTDNGKYINLNYETKYLDKMDSLCKYNFDLDDKINSEYKVDLNLGKKSTILENIIPLKIDNEYYTIICEYALKGNILSLNKTINIKKGFIPVQFKKEWNKNIDAYKAFNSSFIKVTP